MPETEAADVLDHMANPHPRMWREATEAYANRVADPGFWHGYLAAMCAATGYEPQYFLDKLGLEEHRPSWLGQRFYRKGNTGWTRIGPVGWCGRRALTIGIGRWGKTWSR